jgi:hypothetical protein
VAGQTEDAEEITVIERRFALVTHRRQKYCQRPAKQSHPGSPMGSQYGTVTGLWSW